MFRNICKFQTFFPSLQFQILFLNCQVDFLCQHMLKLVLFYRSNYVVYVAWLQRFYVWWWQWPPQWSIWIDFKLYENVSTRVPSRPVHVSPDILIPLWLTTMVIIILKPNMLGKINRSPFFLWETHLRESSPRVKYLWYQAFPLDLCGHPPSVPREWIIKAN